MFTRAGLPAYLGMVALAAAHLACAPATVKAASAVDSRPLAIETIPIDFSTYDPARTRFGRLEWHGGIELTSTDDRFGGLSGVVVSQDATRMVAVSDLGWWFEARLGYASGRLSTVTDARMGRLLDSAGKPFRGKKHQDAESLAAYGPSIDGDLLVAFERDPRILRYPYGRDGMAARPRRLRMPEAVAAGPENKELEAVGRFSAEGPMKGALIAISERQQDKDGNILGWVFDDKRSRQFAVRRIRDFDITDLAIDPQTQALFTLERRFSPFTGAGMQIRRFDVGMLDGHGPLDGEVLIVADQTLTIDNMEGLTATRTVDGELLLTIVSDDNYNGFQRTLLMQFVLK